VYFDNREMDETDHMDNDVVGVDLNLISHLQQQIQLCTCCVYQALWQTTLGSSHLKKNVVDRSWCYTWCTLNNVGTLFTCDRKNSLIYVNN